MVKKLFSKFTVSQDGKVSDKMMTFNIVACIIGMLLCLSSLTAATWAWFGDSITSPVNQVQTGEYKIVVQITDSATGNEILPDSDGAYAVAAGGIYDIKLAASGSVSTGYGAIRFVSDNENKFYTPQIFTESSEKSPNFISFKLISSKNETLVVDSWWGTLSTPNEERDIQDGASYTFDAEEGVLISDVADQLNN